MPNYTIDQLIALRNLLEQGIDDQEIIKAIAKSSGFNVARFNFHREAYLVWHDLLHRANDQIQDKVAVLVKIAWQYDPGNRYLFEAKQSLELWQVAQPADIKALIQRLKNEAVKQNIPEVAQARLVQEVCLNPEQDLLKSVNWLIRGYHACRSVAKLEFDGGCGTGFLVANDLFLTNQHVVWNKTTRRLREFKESRVGFLYDETGKPCTSPIPPSQLEHVFQYISPDEEVDFALVRIQTPFTDRTPLSLNPYAEISSNKPVFILQHPGGQDMQIAINNNILESATEQVICHKIKTNKGSSGSPILNDEWEVVGIHFGGIENVINKGTRISKVLEILQQEQPEIYRRLNIKRN